MAEMANGLGRFVWHDLMSVEPSASKHFYGELFPEWTLVDEEMSPPGMDSFTITKVTAADLLMACIVPFEPSHGLPSHWIGSVAVDDCTAAIARMQEKGGKPCYPPVTIPGVGTFSVVSDAQQAFLKPFQPAGPRLLPTVPAPGHFCWDELLTTDVGAAKELYSYAFGWVPQDVDMGPSGTYTLFNHNGIEVAGAMAMPPTAEAPPHWLPYIAVEDVDQRADKAVSLGAKLYVEPRDIPEVGRFSVIGDPSGATFAVFKSFKRPS